MTTHSSESATKPITARAIQLKIRRGQERKDEDGIRAA